MDGPKKLPVFCVYIPTYYATNFLFFSQLHQGPLVQIYMDWR